MLSLLKKKPDAAAANQTPAWHPNFRNFERLPDTQVVRPTFFVNGKPLPSTDPEQLFELVKSEVERLRKSP